MSRDLYGSSLGNRFVHNDLPQLRPEIFSQALQAGIESTERNMEKIGDRNPKIGTADHQWEYCGPSNWVSGFYAGQLWLCSVAAAATLAANAFKSAALLRKSYHKRLLDHPEWHDHDLGFQFVLTSVAEFRLTGCSEAKEMALAAAESLYARFQPVGKYIVAWNDTHGLGPERTRGKTIVDSLQNVSLLFWASEVSRDTRFREAAIAHSDTLMEHIVREDFSTFHTFDFDPETHRPVKGETFQGYADDSCWSRGQSWAIHGYAQIYSHTGDRKHLLLARKLADYVIARLPEDAVPPWDYNLPSSEPQIRDSSAGAITAAGLLSIAEHCGDSEQAEYYRAWGCRMLEGLIQQCDLTNNPRAMGLLDQGASFVRGGLSNNMLPYGDYYYLEALMRTQGHADFFW